MIIIIEGNDGTGKTTLANDLAKTLHGYKVIHRTHLTDTPKSELAMIYRDLLLKHTNIIFDRAWYSEMAYGPVFRGESCISIEDMHRLEELLHALGGFVVYCHSENAYERACERGEDYVQNYDQWMRVNMNYNEIFKNTEHKAVILEYGF